MAVGDTHKKKHNKNKGIIKEQIRNEIGPNEKYGTVMRNLGIYQFECKFLDNSTTNAVLTGSLIKGPNKQRISVGDFVLLQSSIESNKYYIIHKFSPDDKKRLAKNGQLTQINTTEQIGTTVIIESEIVNKKEKVINDDTDIATLIENI